MEFDEERPAEMIHYITSIVSIGEGYGLRGTRDGDALRIDLYARRKRQTRMAWFLDLAKWPRFDRKAEEIAAQALVWNPTLLRGPSLPDVRRVDTPNLVAGILAVVDEARKGAD